MKKLTIASLVWSLLSFQSPILATGLKPLAPLTNKDLGIPGPLADSKELSALLDDSEDSPSAGKRVASNAFTDNLEKVKKAKSTPKVESNPFTDNLDKTKKPTQKELLYDGGEAGESELPEKNRSTYMAFAIGLMASSFAFNGCMKKEISALPTHIFLMGSLVYLFREFRITEDYHERSQKPLQVAAWDSATEGNEQVKAFEAAAHQERLAEKASKRKALNSDFFEKTLKVVAGLYAVFPFVECTRCGGGIAGVATGGLAYLNCLPRYSSCRSREANCAGLFNLQQEEPEAFLPNPQGSPWEIFLERLLGQALPEKAQAEDKKKDETSKTPSAAEDKEVKSKWYKVRANEREKNLGVASLGAILGVRNRLAQAVAQSPDFVKAGILFYLSRIVRDARDKWRHAATVYGANAKEYEDIATALHETLRAPAGHEGDDNDVEVEDEDVKDEEDTADTDLPSSGGITPPSGARANTDGCPDYSNCNNGRCSDGSTCQENTGCPDGSSCIGGTCGNGASCSRGPRRANTDGCPDYSNCNNGRCSDGSSCRENTVVPTEVAV